MTEPNGSGEVRYTVKEMFAEIQADLREIKQAVENKADKTMLLGIETRLTHLEVSGSRTAQVTEANLNTFRREQNEETDKLRTRLYNLETGTATAQGGQAAALRFIGWGILITGIVTDVILRFVVK